MNRTRCGRKRSRPYYGLMAPFSWYTFCFVLKWGENLSLGSMVVSAPIVSTADDRRVNECRTPVKKK